MTLYVIPLSHPALSARLMLQHKGMAHRVVRLVSGLHPALLRLVGFPRGTVPGLSIGRQRIQGSVAIARFLEEIQPDPPLYPAASRLRESIIDAERWGEAVLQDVPRRLVRWAMYHDRGLRRYLARCNRLPLPGATAIMMKPLVGYFAFRKSGADDETVRADLERLPELLDHADALIDDGIIGERAPNAATFQIAPTIRLLLNFRQLRHMFHGRAVKRLALAVCPEYPGDIPEVFPSSWLGEKA